MPGDANRTATRSARAAPAPSARAAGKRGPIGAARDPDTWVGAAGGSTTGATRAARTLSTWSVDDLRLDGVDLVELVHVGAVGVRASADGVGHSVDGEQRVGACVACVDIGAQAVEDGV